MSLITDIGREIALKAHGGSINKHDGELYLLHVHRVVIGARSQALREGVDPDLAEAVAWCHDVVEDTPWTLTDIRRAFTVEDMLLNTVFEIVHAVELLTKDGGSNEAYYRRIKENKLATVVKRADLQDNFSRNHKIEDPATKARMAAKYSLGMDILG